MSLLSLRAVQEQVSSTRCGQQDKYIKQMLASSPVWHCVVRQFLPAPAPAVSPLLEFTEATSIAEATRALAHRHMMSAPVVGADGKLRGVVSVWDIVSYTKSRVADTRVGELEGLDEELASTSVSTLIRPSDPLNRDACIGIAFRWFSGGLQHIFLVDDDQKVVAVATQSSAVRFVAPFLMESTLGQMTVEQIGFVPIESRPFSVRESDSIWAALDKITDIQKTAVAVVNDQGQLTGNLSVRDFLGIECFSDLQLLGRRVVDHLASLSPEALQPVTVKKDATLHEVIYKIVSHRIYRVWVVDDSGVPVGVISNTDICDLVNREFGVDA